MTLSARTIAIRYVGFAAVATVVNLIAQQGVIWLYSGTFSLQGSILVGTGIGFTLKYLLDKYFVFHDRVAGANMGGELGKVGLYGLTGVATTALFWGAEVGAWAIFHSANAKYAGAIAGIATGYWVKYQLDKRFVFARRGAT